MSRIMRKTFFTLIAALFAFMPAGYGENLALVSGGRPKASIVLPEKPVKAELLAAAELNEHIKLITGTELPVINEKQQSEGMKVYIGATKRAEKLDLMPEHFKEQEYVIKFVPDGVILVGRDKRDYSNFSYRTIDKISGLSTYDVSAWPDWWDEKGTVYAAYDFLRDYCGVRWFDFTDYGIDYATRNDLIIDCVDRRRVPAFAMRDIHTLRSAADYPAACSLWYEESAGFANYINEAFAAISVKCPDASSRVKRTLIANQVHAYLFRSGNGGTGYFHPNHSLYDYYGRFWEKDERFPSVFEKAKPEYFAKGYPESKKPPQLCYTNPELVKQVVKDASDWFAGRPFGVSKDSFGGRKWIILQQIARDYYPVVPMDNSSYCKCENCRRWYNAYVGSTYAENKGMYSDYIFNFVNSVAREIKEKYPERKIGALAYATYLHVPKNVKLESNIMLMFCPVLRDVYSESRQQTDREMLKKWSETGVQLYLWLYYCFPTERSTRGGGKWHVFPGFFAHSLAASFREYKERGVRGMFFNGFGQEVEAYVTFEMLDDPDQDVDNLIDEYFNRMYGPAAPPLRKLYCRIEEIYCNPKNYPKEVADRARQSELIAWGLLGNHDRMEELNSLIKEAREKIKSGNELQKKRFNLFDLSTLKYIEQGRQMFTAKNTRQNTVGYNSCASLLTDANGDLNAVNWEDSQGLNIWKSNYGECIASQPRAEVAHDGRFIYLRLRELELNETPKSGKNIVDGDYWQVMFMSKNDKTFKMDKLIRIAPDGKQDVPEGLVHQVKSEVKGDMWTVSMVLPLSKLPQSGNSIYFNLARSVPGIPPAMLMPTMGAIDNPSSYLKLTLESVKINSGRVSNDNLVARWDFEETGADVRDSSPKAGNNGELQGVGFKRIPGPFGSALELDRRIRCEYFDVSSWSGAGGELSFAAWINIDPISSVSAGKLTYTLLSGDNAYVCINDQVFRISQNEPKLSLSANRLLTPGQWEYVAVTVNKSGTSLYVNGRLSGTSKIRFSLPSAGKSLRIGAEEKLQFHRQYRGAMDRMEIHARAMEGSEIMARYKTGLAEIAQFNKSNPDLDSRPRSKTGLNYDMLQEDPD